MEINPGFTWSDVVGGVNSFLALEVVSGMLVGMVVLGLAGVIAGAIRKMVGSEE